MQDSNVSFGSVIGSTLFSLSIYEIKKCILSLQSQEYKESLESVQSMQFEVHYFQHFMDTHILLQSK